MELHNYEKLCPQKARGQALLPRLLLILGYLIWLSLWFLIFVRVAFSPALLVLMIALSICLVVFTWKYVRVEYEYAIYSGSFFVAKIYGKTKRKELLELDLKKAVLIAPRTQEHLEAAEHYPINNVLWAVSSPKADNLWLIVFPENEKSYSLLYFEADENAIKILRRENPRAVAKNI